MFKEYSALAQHPFVSKYVPDGKSYVLEISPVDRVKDGCERGVHCWIKDREEVRKSADETLELSSLVSTTLISCQREMKTWMSHVGSCAEIGTLTARTSRCGDIAKDRNVVLASAGCKEFWESDEQVAHNLNCFMEAAARFVTHVYNTRGLVQRLEMSVPAQPSKDGQGDYGDSKSAAHGAAAAPSHSGSAGKHRAEK